MRNYLLNEVFKDSNGVVLFVFAINEDGERTYHVTNEPIEGFLYRFNSKTYRLSQDGRTDILKESTYALSDYINLELFGKKLSQEWVWIETHVATDVNEKLPKLTLEVLEERGIKWPVWAAYAVVSNVEYAYFYDERGEAHQEIPGKWDASDWPNSKIMNPEHEKAGFEVDVNHSAIGRKFHAGDKVKIIDETSKNKGRTAIVSSNHYVFSPGKILVNFCKDIAAMYNENQLELVEKADPSKLPDWLAVGELIYDDTLGYGRIVEKIDGCTVKIRFLRDSMTVFLEKFWMKQARVRPWDFKTAPFSFKVESDNGGTVFWLRGNGYVDENGRNHYSFDEVAKHFEQIDRSPCGIYEHLTNEGNWLE
jgi:hypothetical protein